jgi:undecaprenyl-diphosphatase
MEQSHVFDRFDLPVLDVLSGFSGRSPLFDHVINAISRLDLFKGVLLMCLFWYVWAQHSDVEPVQAIETRRIKLTRVLIGTILLGALSRALQVTLPVHQRPRLSGLGLTFPPIDFSEATIGDWNSFPSDHSFFFFGLSVGLWSVNRAVGTFALIWTAVMIALPRVYLGVHYPSDVVAGALLGIMGMAAILAVPMRWGDGLLSRARTEHSGLFYAGMFFASEEVAHLMSEMRELAAAVARVLLH